jgi:uncharacterized Tic20 family protein
MNGIDNEEGTTYTLIWIFALLAMAGILYLAFSPLIGSFVSTTNEYGEEGKISAQTSKAVDFGVTLFLLMPVIVVIGLFLYNYVSSVDDKRRLGGI